MNTTQPTTLALNSTWTDTTLSPTYANNPNTATVLSNAGSGYFVGGYWYPYYTPITPQTWITVDTGRIRLTMAEVEALRVAAKRDKALKATLEKFTEHIEVIVDFDKK
jgi:hypothetical protein